MTQTPEEDTSPTSVTQGGRRQRIGQSIWWVLAVAVIALAIGAFVIISHKDAPAEHNTAHVARAVGMIAPGRAGPAETAA